MNISFTVGNVPANPDLDVYVVVQAPQGLSLSGNLCTSTGQCTAAYKLVGGQHESMRLNAAAGQAGEFVLLADVTWNSPGGTPVRTSATLELKVVEPVEGETHVFLHVTQTEVNVGDPVTLQLAATNSIAKPPMTLKFSLETPVGWSLSGSEFVDSCAGLCSHTYGPIESGQQKNITLTMLPNQAGRVNVEAVLEWYFGADQSTLERRVERLTLNAVDGDVPSTSVPPESTPTKEVVEPPGGNSTQIPLFVGLGAVVALFAVAVIILYVRRS